MSSTAERRRLRQQYQELLDRHVIARVRDGRTAGVAALLEAGASVNGSPALDFPPVIHAAGFGNVNMIRMLIQNGANVNIGTSRPLRSADGGVQMVPGCRALHIALRDGHVEAYRMLLESGADPNAADQQGHTPVMAICNMDGLGAAQRVAALREVLDAGGDSSLANIYGHTAMHFAVSREDSTGLIDVLWSKSPSTLSKPDREGVTPLGLAAHRGRPRSIARLLALGAVQPIEFNQIPIQSRQMPLINAIVENQVSCVGTLLSAGLEANGGSEVLAFAIFGSLTLRCGKILQRLLHVEGEEGEYRWANLFCGDGPILHTASSFANVAALSVLLAAGANETAVDNNGRLAADKVGDLVVDDGRERSPAEDAACRRMLERAPAFRALSWSFPVGENDDSIACRQHGGGLGVRVFRPRSRTFLVRHVGRREGSTGCLGIVRYEPEGAIKGR